MTPVLPVAGICCGAISNCRDYLPYEDTAKLTASTNLNEAAKKTEVDFQTRLTLDLARTFD